MMNSLEHIIQTDSVFDSMQLLRAYEQAVDANIISTITDIKGYIIHANQKFCDVSKYSSEEIIGQNHRLINSGFHPSEFFTTMWKTISTGNVWHGEIKNKAKDGSFYWVDTVIVPLKNEAGKNTHYLSLRTLITERKDLEKKKASYVSSLEVLMVMTSNKIKRPLINSLAAINNFDFSTQMNPVELKKIMEDLKKSATELNNFTNELSVFIREMEQ